MKLQLLALFTGASMLCSISAHNVGQYGRVWGIAEVNAKQVIANELAQKNTRHAQLTLKKSLTSIGQHLPPANLPNAQKRVTRYYDPSGALGKDIVVRGRLLYKKGTWVNPLKVVRPVQNMLYFNARDKAQLTFAINALTKMPTRLMLVTTGGDPIKLAAKLHRPVYYARPALIARFHIRAVPSLLGVGKGLYRYRLAVTTFRAPYKIAQVVACWHGCPISHSQKEPA